MDRSRRTVLLRALLIGSLVALQTGSAVAQIPDPLNTNTGGTLTQDTLDQTTNTVDNTIPDDNTVTDTTNTVTDTVNQTVDQTTDTVTETTNTVNQTTNTVTETVNQTVDQTTDTVTETTNTATNTVNQTVNQTTNTVNQTTNTGNQTVNETTNTATNTVNQTVKGTTTTVNQTATGTTGTVNTGTVTGTVNTGTQDAISALGGATGQYGPVASGTDPVISPSSGPADAISAIAAAAGGSGSTAGLLALSGGTTGITPDGQAGVFYASSRMVSSGVAKRFLGARFLLNWTAILGVAQPSLAILVDAVNDADEDGIYSDTEIAAAPGSEVSFKALITNIGAVNFEIASVTHGYNGGTGPAQGDVCGELTGIMLAPGESLACSFPVPGYAPAKGETMISTITAAGFEVGKGARRGASDSDTSQVDTLVAVDEVFGVAIERNLAFTGTDAARLLAVALLLLGAGGMFLAMARARGRAPMRPLPAESTVDLVGWWGAGPARSNSKWRAWRR
jgi:uncharacterized membrane protein